MNDNPFILEPYRTKDLFCDRETETEEILRNIENGRNTTLISPRRLGKTGLILRVFDEIACRNLPYETIYADISDTMSLEDFVKVLSEAILGKLKNQRRIADYFKSLRNIRPLLGLDPLSGSPQLSFTFMDDTQKQNTLKDVLDYLERYPKKVVLAIDEFQQIREYGDVNMEAVLRKQIQHLHNVRFIYCGSKKHTMTDMFTNAKQPFYESTSFVFLTKLPVPVYSDFIREKFRLCEKAIDEEAVNDILEWTKVHTYYTQRVCNVVYESSGAKIGREDAQLAFKRILETERERFQELRRLLTRSQWKMLRAIAKEDEVSQITSSTFLSKYGISSGATALRNIKALIDKELVLVTNENDRTSYSVYNVFLSRYLDLDCYQLP